MPTPTRALTVGSAMVDIIVIVDSSNVERMTMHNATSSFLLLEQGRKIEAESVSEHIGGGAINAAVSFCRLGLETAVLAKLGRDGNGEKITARLLAEGANTNQLLHSDKHPSGTAVMVSSHDRNATIFTQRGANTEMRIAEVPPESFVGLDLVFVANLSNASADCFPEIVRNAKAAKAFVATNPGIRQLTSRTGDLLRTLAEVDLLAINRVEAEALVPRMAAGDMDENISATVPSDIAEFEPARLMRLGLTFGGFDVALPGFFRRVLGLGCKRMLITDGTHGAYLADADGIHYCESVRVTPRGTAGAGDAFNSTFTAMLATDVEVATAMRAAALNAAAVVGSVDTQSGLHSREVLLREVNSKAAEIAVKSWSWDRF